MTNLYCLTNFIDFSLAIHQPLKHSNRIKYTCFDISKNFIILGASSGSLYLFNRLGKFLLLIPSKYGCITQLAISASERYVAFATQRSVICVYVINLSAQAAPQVIFTNLCRHQTVQVTCIHWIPDEKLFYYGDSKGQVNLVVLNTFIGTNILNMSVHPILFLDSPIVTIDDYESLLLISNLTKCLLCNTEYEEYKQIGNKPREGIYGGCFFVCQQEHTNQQISRIYCSRPGSRLWEVDLDGEVLQTHQFKTALACPPTKIYKHQFTNDNANFASDTDNDGNDEMLDYPEQNLQFPKLQKLSQDFLLAHTEFAIYIFDMRKSSLVLWCNQFERIIDVRVVHEEIIVFTQTGSLYSVQLRSLQAQACTLLQQRKFYECARLMRKNVKYFADKAREEYDLHVLNQIKHFLIERHQYELLNDLSVIFDAIGQCESSGDTNSSGGSSVMTDRSSSLPTPASRFTNNQQQKETNNCPQPSVYKLENAFCDNLKSHKGVTKPLKDALLIVTGKFGKNIIKYKFNIFQDEQQKLVKDLIPPEERSLPFKDIKAIYDNGEPEEEIVSRSLKIMSDNQTSMKASNLSVNEEKTIYNLYLICKSSKFSNTHFLERYRSLFDEYTAPELIEILQKLTQLMIDNGDAPHVAQRLCYEMYFHYLNAELIWEMDDNSRQYITDGFKLINNCEDIVRCDHCSFPLRFDTTCQFYELGSTLLRYYWSRNEQIKCFDVLTNTPALFDVLARLYMDEFNIDKVLPIILNYGQPELLNELGKHFTLMTWSQCFEQFVALQQGRMTCINCETTTIVDNINRHFFYTWNCFLNIALEYIQAEDILSLILKWSNFIPNDAIDREFYISCLIKGMI